MEITLNHAEVDQRANELAGLIFERDEKEIEQDGVLKDLKKKHDKILAEFDKRIRLLAGAVKNWREDTQLTLSIAEAPEGDPSDHVGTGPDAQPDDVVVGDEVRPDGEQPDPPGSEFARRSEAEMEQQEPAQEEKPKGRRGKLKAVEVGK